MKNGKERARPEEGKKAGALPAHRRRLSMFGRSATLPESQILRLGIGILLCLGGTLWFLPMFGLWMLPLGLAVLSIDIPFVRRHSRRALFYFRRRYPRAAAKLFPRSR